jgi:hypothetical protein
LKFVVCINNENYAASLELHKIYVCITGCGRRRGWRLRVIDESGEDICTRREVCPDCGAEAVQKSSVEGGVINLTQ